MMYSGQKKRAEDRSRRVRASEWFWKTQFIWWPLVLAGVAYPAKVVSGLRAHTDARVAKSDTANAIRFRELQLQVDTIKADAKAGKTDRAEIRDISEALLAATCADLPRKEQIRRRIVKQCDRIGAAPYVPSTP